MWLEGFLNSSQVPDGAMQLETIDGYMTALVIGPASVSPSEWLKYLWDADGRQSPNWDSLEQANYVLVLLMKNWNAIAARRMADAPHEPFIEPLNEAFAGRDWAEGFLVGAELRDDAWAPLIDSRRSNELFMSIYALVDDDPKVFATQITPKVRIRLLDQLPVVLKSIAAFWRDGGDLPRSEPMRSTKVGRNDPCPCGSGKKYKKCCANKPPPVMH